MVVIVGSAVLGREVHDELGRIRRGERPSEHEVRKQWDEIITEGRARWAGVREQVERRRAARRERRPAKEARGRRGRPRRRATQAPRRAAAEASDEER